MWEHRWSRFENEVEALQLLRGVEGIAQIVAHGVGGTREAGTGWIAMLHGGKPRGNTRFPSWEELGQAARAVDRMRVRGIVHRDLKPTNMVVDDDGRLTLVDFGLVKARGGWASLDAPDPPVGVLHTDVTQGGAVAGTPLYIAPEQCRGELPHSGGDVYALACMAYAKINEGKALWSGCSTRDLMQRHAYRIPPSPKDCKHPAWPMIRAALSKDPEDRPSPRAFATMCQEQGTG